MGTLGPTTHITSLAHAHEYFCIQMVDPYLLRDALDASTDLRHDRGDTMGREFTALMEKKYESCSEWFTSNLAVMGIQEPLVVILMSDGRWWMDEGHHRLAWALLNHVEVPVIFDDTGADEESHMGWLVSRPNVSAYHYNVVDDKLEDDLALVDDVESAFAEVSGPVSSRVCEVKDESVFIPSQGRGGRHRSGKHRAPVVR